MIEPNYTFLEKYHCSICGEPYGRINRKYGPCDIWVTCKCQKDDGKIYFFNTASIKLNSSDLDARYNGIIINAQADFDAWAESMTWGE